jgi:hypothetical protein
MGTVAPYLLSTFVVALAGYRKTGAWSDQLTMAVIAGLAFTVIASLGSGSIGADAVKSFGYLLLLVAVISGTPSIIKA